MVHSQDLHLCFDPRLRRTEHWRKNDIHLDDRIHRRACGGQNIDASYTNVPCHALTLKAIAARPLPTENCRGSHSIANGLSPFYRMLGCSCNARVSTFNFPGRLVFHRFAKSMGIKDWPQVVLCAAQSEIFWCSQYPHFQCAPTHILGAIRSTLHKTRPSPRLMSNFRKMLWTEERGKCPLWKTAQRWCGV